MTLSDIEKITLEEVEKMSRQRLFDVFKFINPRGALSQLARQHGYHGSNPNDMVWRICKGEGKNQRYNDEILDSLRLAICKHIEKINIPQNNNAEKELVSDLANLKG